MVCPNLLANSPGRAEANAAHNRRSIPAHCPSMAITDQFLKEILASIEPSPTTKDRARRSHKFLRDELQTGHFKNRIVDHYLSGSYSRDTAIEPLDDVDIVFVIDPGAWQSGLNKFFNWKPDPIRVLNSFQAAVRHRYPNSSVLGQRRSVGLAMNHLHIDIVPAIADDSRQDYIWIPDRRTQNWILSGPKVHSAAATRVNEMNRQMLKPLVKLLKSWNSNLPGTARVRSFVVESMATRIFSTYRFESLQDGLLMYFDFVAWLRDEKAFISWQDPCGMSFSWGTLSVPDVADTRSNVAANVDSMRYQRFADKARLSRNHLNKGIASNSVRLLSAALRVY